MEILRSGRWLYDDTVEMPVDIVGLPYDFWFELAKADDQLEPNDKPLAPGESGLLFYVRFRHAGETSTPTWPDSGAFETIDAAMRAAQAKAPPARFTGGELVRVSESAGIGAPVLPPI